MYVDTVLMTDFNDKASNLFSRHFLIGVVIKCVVLSIIRLSGSLKKNVFLWYTFVTAYNDQVAEMQKASVTAPGAQEMEQV